MCRLLRAALCSAIGVHRATMEYNDPGQFFGTVFIFIYIFRPTTKNIEHLSFPAFAQ